MKIDMLLASDYYQSLQRKSIDCEKMGFDCVWTFEAQHDAYLPLAFASAATSTLEIGTNIAVAFARAPFSTAQIAWDLQKYSGGRFKLGLGTQVRPHIEKRFSAKFDSPADRIKDYIKCVRSIWQTFQTGARPSYDGQFYQFKLINDFFNPGAIEEPNIPIYLAGVNSRMCEAAGEVADGFHVHPMHSQSYIKEKILPNIAKGASKAGRDLKGFELYAPVFVVTGTNQYDKDKMEMTVKKQIAFYGSTPSYAAILKHHGFEDLGRQLNTLMRKGNIDKMIKTVPDELLHDLVVVGEPSNLGKALKEKYDGILDRVSLYLSMDDEGSVGNWEEIVMQIHSE